MATKKEFSFSIEKHIATLSGTAGRSCEVNIIAFCDAEPRVDIRRWVTKDGEKRMGKGICLTNEEVTLLRDALNSMEELA